MPFRCYAGNRRDTDDARVNYLLFLSVVVTIFQQQIDVSITRETSTRFTDPPWVGTLRIALVTVGWWGLLLSTVGACATTLFMIIVGGPPRVQSPTYIAAVSLVMCTLAFAVEPAVVLLDLIGERDSATGWTQLVIVWTTITSFAVALVLYIYYLYAEHVREMADEIARGVRRDTRPLIRDFSR